MSKIKQLILPRTTNQEYFPITRSSRKAQDTQIKQQGLKVEWPFFFLFYHARIQSKTLKPISKILEDTGTIQLTSHRLCSQSNSQLGHILQKHFGIKLQNGEVVEITHFSQNHWSLQVSSQPESLVFVLKSQLAGDLTSPPAPAWLEK